MVAKCRRVYVPQIKGYARSKPDRGLGIKKFFTSHDVKIEVQLTPENLALKALDHELLTRIQKETGQAITQTVAYRQMAESLAFG